MKTADLLFYLLGGVSIASALGVVLMSNPIFSALMLALTMTAASAIFFSLGAYFISGVQLIVYAGAVMVMFVMVVMLIDLKSERKIFSRGAISNGLKIFSSIVLACVVLTSAGTVYVAGGNKFPDFQDGTAQTKALAEMLFTRYLFGFEAIGVLLLVVLVGAIAIARAKGGTHAKPS